MTTRNFYGKKNKVILPITNENKSYDSNLSSDDQDDVFPLCFLMNGSSSDSDSSYKEEYEQKTV